MAKIKGWKKKKTEGMQIQAWKSDRGTVLIIVDTVGNEGYYIGIKKREMTHFTWLMYGKKIPIIEKRAVAWMRQNPNG